MGEVREIMIETIKEIRAGQCPLDTAKEMHLSAHRAVMDSYADVARERMSIKNVELKASLDAMRAV